MILVITLTHHDKPSSIGRVDLTRPARHWTRLKSGDRGTIGVHVFAAKYGEWTYGILRFTNGVINRDGSGFCGTVYAEKLEVTAQPFDSRARPLAVKLLLPPKFKRTPFLFRPRGTLQVPFYYNAKSDDLKPPQQMIDALNLKVQPLVGPNGYGPTNSLEPDLDKRDAAIRYGNIVAGLRIVDSGMGEKYQNSAENIAHEYKLAGPYSVEGYPNGYAHGGFGIDPCHGYDRVPEAVWMHSLLHRANMHRQFCDAIDAETGEPISLYAWNKPPGRDLMKGQPDRSSEVELMCFLEGSYEKRRYPVFNAPSRRPEYEDLFWSYRPNDLAHIIRNLRHTIPVIDYGGRHPAAMCARFDLLMMAEDARYQQWSDRTDELVKPSYPGEWVANSLARVLQDPPGQGHHRLDRQAAWMAYLGACVMKYFQRPKVWQEWSENMLRAILIHQTKSGISHCDENTGGAFPAGGQGTKTFHSVLLAIGAYSLQLQIGKGTTAPPPSIEKMADALLNSHEPLAYGAGYQYGPAHWIQVKQDGAILDQLAFFGEGDPAHVLMLCALMARGERKDFWIDRALKMNVPHSSRMERLSWLKSCKDKSWTAELEAVMERECV
jgi:hypothetical protein